MTANKTQLDRIESALIGNGREGLIARTARMEEQLKVAVSAASDAKSEAEKARATAEVLSDLLAEKHNELSSDISSIHNDVKLSLVQLTASVTAHHNSTHLAEVMKKKSFWVTIIGAYVFLHLIATYVQNAWDWLMLMLGIPKLIIPLA